MPSPLLAEDEILQSLNDPVDLQHLDNIRLGIMLATIDGRDRKLLREPFVDLVNSGYNLTNLIGRIYAYNYVKGLMAQGKFDLGKLDEIIGALTVSAEAFRTKLKTQMEQVIQCPHDEDSKH